ncbi:MAG: hypothetical protein HY778_03770 [Betaproteobacteria bacterium]|nr:hypothetical protein [Betaproteobacteria bacterium]
MRDGAADDGSGDVVQEAREHEDDRQQHEGALPVVGQEARQRLGHAAVLEMPQQQGEAQRQPEQVGAHHPFVGHVGRQAGKARAEPETRKHQLAGGNGGQAA